MRLAGRSEQVRCQRCEFCLFYFCTAVRSRRVIAPHSIWSCERCRRLHNDWWSLCSALCFYDASRHLCILLCKVAPETLAFVLEETE